MGIKGNEEIDMKVKKAAEQSTSNKKDLPPLLRKKIEISKSALKQHRRSQLKACWVQKWKTSPRYYKTNAIDSFLPSNNSLKLISNDQLSRTDISHIGQLQTGHIPLYAYLARIEKVTNTGCPASRHPKEDTRHLLIDCPSYVH